MNLSNGEQQIFRNVPNNFKHTGNVQNFEVKNISNRCQKVIAFNGHPLVSQTTIACLVKTR